MFNPFNYLSKYPVDVVVHERRKDGIFIWKDKARRIEERKDGEIIYKLRKKNWKIKPQSYRNIMITGKGKHVLYLYSPEPKQFFPMEINEGKELLATDQFGDMVRIKNPNPDTQFKILPEENKNWLIHRYRKNYERFKPKGWIEKYLPIIMIILTAIGMAIIIQVTLSGLNVIIGNVAGALEGVAESLDVLITKVGGQVAGQPVPTTQTPPI